MLLGSSTVRRLPFSIYAQLQCKWLSGVADKKTGLETEVQKPSIKLKPEETLYKKRNEVPKAAPKPSYFTSFYLDTHDSVLQLQTAGHFCMCTLVSTLLPSPPHTHIQIE